MLFFKPNSWHFLDRSHLGQHESSKSITRPFANPFNNLEGIDTLVFLSEAVEMVKNVLWKNFTGTLATDVFITKVGICITSSLFVFKIEQNNFQSLGPKELF
jgi:hypothetical protein